MGAKVSNFSLESCDGYCSLKSIFGYCFTIYNIVSVDTLYRNYF